MSYQTSDTAIKNGSEGPPKKRGFTQTGKDTGILTKPQITMNLIFILGVALVFVVACYDSRGSDVIGTTATTYEEVSVDTAPSEPEIEVKVFSRNGIFLYRVAGEGTVSAQSKPSLMVFEIDGKLIRVVNATVIVEER